MEQFTEGGCADNLTKVIIEALKKHGNVFNVDITTKLTSFGATGVNVSKGCTMQLTAKSFFLKCFSFGKHPLHGTLHDLTRQTLT